MTEENPEEELFSAPKHRIRELEQEAEIMKEYITVLSSKEKDSEPTELENMQKDDLHEKKELEQEKLFLEEINKSLEEKSELEIEQFLNMISHELKTPIVPIKAYVQMLEEGEFGSLTETQKQKLRVVDSSTRQLVQFISNTIGFQKFIVGKIELQKKKVDIKRIIMDAYSLFWSELESRGMIINSNFTDETMVMCDPKLISQVLENLIQIGFNTSLKINGKFRIVVLEPGKDVEVSATYHGGSSFENELSKIFSNSSQIDTSKVRADGGIRMGLTFCRQIIEAHGGKIWFESKTENEKVISFTLPKGVLENMKNKPRFIVSEKEELNKRVKEATEEDKGHTKKFSD